MWKVVRLKLKGTLTSVAVLMSCRCPMRNFIVFLNHPIQGQDTLVGTNQFNDQEKCHGFGT
uniref:Uncharacterized protein n=1 Tax=Arundo donax TaxID=35708 RepID=A0A0A9AX11_ARUDO